MNKKRKANTLSLYEILDTYQDEASAIKYFEHIRWGDKAVCTKCGCDEKHCWAYANEFAFRLNDGNCERDTQDRLGSLFSRMAGKTITYKELTKGGIKSNS